MIQEQSQATFAEYKTQIYTYTSKMVQLLYLSPLCCTGSTLHGAAWNIGYIQLSQRKEYSTETVRSSCIHCYSIGLWKLWQPARILPKFSLLIYFDSLPSLSQVSWWQKLFGPSSLLIWNRSISFHS